MTAGRKVHIVWKRSNPGHPWNLHRVCSSLTGANVQAFQLRAGGWMVKVTTEEVNRASL